MRRGFYIGRFQPYHDGHHSMVEHIADEVDELVLGIGSADDSHTRHDPFTAGERVMMLTKALAEFDLVTYTVPIEDLDRNAVWVSHVRSMSPTFDVAYSNNPLVVQLFKEAGVPVEQSPMFNREKLEGREIRERMIAGGNWAASVPEPVAAVVREIDGIERIRRVSDTDANGHDAAPGDTGYNDPGANARDSGDDGDDPATDANRLR
ncbi:nicotinamide-nucleotide adenylyltransferase [Halobacteriales archaeon QS_4_69_34]|nr:MAG: nicotinamide-nucleotide adenylyltransferase [Halobacteriales archaeon QS_4_69_34]